MELVSRLKLALSRREGSDWLMFLDLKLVYIIFACITMALMTRQWRRGGSKVMKNQTVKVIVREPFIKNT